MRLLEDSLAEAILSGQINDSDRALVDVNEGGEVTISAIAQPAFAPAIT